MNSLAVKTITIDINAPRFVSALQFMSLIVSHVWPWLKIGIRPCLHWHIWLHRENIKNRCKYKWNHTFRQKNDASGQKAEPLNLQIPNDN